jgi:hypothetical protein
MADGASEHDEILQLPNNRQLHYAWTGDAKSTTVVIFFSGYLSIGIAHQESIPKPLRDVHPQWIAPSIPGNGQSSSTPKNKPYNVNLCETISSLLEETHPSDNSKGNAIKKLYIAGGSYGTVPAQMIYGAPYSLFPLGRKIAGVLLAAPFSPFRYHHTYTKDMTWPNWFSVGPPSQWIPFRLVPRLLSTFLAWSFLRSARSAQEFMDKCLWSKMGKEEQVKLETFTREELHITPEQFKANMAEGAMKCTANWDGFIEGPDVLHSDWGYDPSKLDADHAGKPVLIVQSDQDELGMWMGRWLGEKYGNAKVKVVEGGHLAALFESNQIWRELLDMEAK